MKLHLPKTLLVAVLAACVAPAWAFNGPTGADYGVDKTFSAENITNIESDSSFTGVSGSVSISAAGKDIKLSGTGANTEITLGEVEAASLWLAQGKYEANANSSISTAGNLYLGGGTLQVKGSVTLGKNQAISLGNSSFTGNWPAEYDRIKNAAILVGHWESQNSSLVVNGDVSLQEASRIALQEGGDLTLNGALSGSFSLTVGHFKGKYTTASSTLTIVGDTSNFSGALSLLSNTDDNSKNLVLALGNSSINLGGLSSDNNRTAITLAEGTTTSILKINVAEAGNYTYTGSIAAGISIEKDGAGTQSLSGDRTLGAVTVNAGKLNLTGAATLGNTTVADSASLVIGKAATLTGTLTGKLTIETLDGFETTTTDEYFGGTNTGNGYSRVNIQAIADASTTKEGINIKVADETFLTNADGAIHGAKDFRTFYVNTGTENLTNDIVTKASTYRVSDEATLDIKGQKLTDDIVTLATNATLKNSGNATGDNQKQLPKLKLTGNAKVDASNGAYGLIEGDYAESHLWLNGHTLTKTGTGEFYLVATTIHDGGTILISEGTFKIGSSQGNASAKTTAAEGTIFKTTAGSTLSIINNNTLKAAGVQGTGGKITGTAGTGIELNSANNYSFGGAVEGSVDLTKKGTGTQTFTGTTALDAVEVQAGKLAFASDNASVNSANVTGGTLEIASGKTLTATGTMTIGAGTLALSSESAFDVTGAMTFNAGAQLSYTLTATPADTDTKLSYTLGRADSFAGLDNLTYTGNTPDGYTGLLSADGNNLMLNFVLTEMELTSITVTKVVGFADGVLTLKTDAANALAYVFGEQLDVAIDDDLWKSAIADVTDDYAQAFSITLQNAEGSEISFGENQQLAVVLNSQSGTVLSPTTAGTYSVPEPTTATLSLLALAALAARRRRK